MPQDAPRRGVVRDVGAGERAVEAILALLERVASGGQTDADQAGRRAAKASGIATGGWMPRGFLDRGRAATRLRRRVRHARATIEACRKLGRSCLRVEERSTRPSHVAAWIVAHRVKALNVAGNRESRAPGIGARVERFLADVFMRLGRRPI